jgi:hypothetical protein
MTVGVFVDPGGDPDPDRWGICGGCSGGNGAFTVACPRPDRTDHRARNYWLNAPTAREIPAIPRGGANSRWYGRAPGTSAIAT